MFMLLYKEGSIRIRNQCSNAVLEISKLNSTLYFVPQLPQGRIFLSPYRIESEKVKVIISPDSTHHFSSKCKTE